MSAGDAERDVDEAVELEQGEDHKDKKDKKEKKRLKKLQKALAEAQQPLESWERYRALHDAFEMEQDLVDLADHKARFALIIMGALNAATLILGTRGEVVAFVPHALRAWLAAYVGAYALVALYFFIQAIESLRPRAAKPNVPYPGAAGLEDHPLGLRFYVDVLKRDVQAYRSAWRETHIGQLNAEVAIQVYLLASINKTKYRALTRLYAGLKLMTLLTAGLISAIAFFALAHPGEGMALLRKDTGRKEAKAAAPAHPTLTFLSEPRRYADTGAREPSGVAFHPRLGHLFLIGDEGSLVELDTNGQALWVKAGLGNLEDVAVHTPSGNLVLLSEKKSQLLLYDPVARKELRKWKLDTQAVLAAEPGDKNQGFEGLSFREDPSRPGGGLFYLTHQRSPSMLVALSLDPERPSGPLGAEAVVGRFSLEKFKDLTAVTWAASLQRLLVIADARDRILVVRVDGHIDAEVVLPGIQQEGLCFDAAGNLWVADDRGGLLEFEGALKAFEEHLGALGATAPSGK